MLSENIEQIKEVVNCCLDEDIVRKGLSELEKFDEYTYSHSLRVAEYAIKIGMDYYLNRDDLILLGVAGCLHDIGKMQIPKEILCKPAKLTANEYNTVKQHALYSAIWVNGHYGSNKLARVVAAHHEKVDGTGYPFGIRSNDILVHSRILCVADIYDAITSKRVYRSSVVDNDEAYAQLLGDAGIDVNIVHELMNLGG